MTLLLTGVPQLAMAVSDPAIIDEAHSLRSVRRALLLDKAVGSRFALGPLGSAVRTASERPESSPVAAPADSSRALRDASRARPQPSRRHQIVMLILYRHSSNYT